MDYVAEERLVLLAKYVVWIILQIYCKHCKHVEKFYYTVAHTYVPLTLEIYPLGELCIYVHNIILCICINIVIYFNIIIFIIVARL